MSSLHVLSQRGDSCISWDATKVTLGESHALAAIQEAERIFREAQTKGAIAFAIDDQAHPTRITEFLPNANRIIIVPCLVGG